MNQEHIDALLDNSQAGGLRRSKFAFVATLDAREAVSRMRTKATWEAEAIMRNELRKVRCQMARLIASEDQWPLDEIECPVDVFNYVTRMARDLTLPGDEQLRVWKAGLREHLKAVSNIDIDLLATGKESDSKHWDDHDGSPRRGRRGGHDADNTDLANGRAAEARAAMAQAAKRAESSKLANLYAMLRNMLECASPHCYADVEVDDDFIAAVDSFDWDDWDDCNLNALDCRVSEVLPGLKLARERAADRDPFDRGDAPSSADNTDLSTGRAIEAREWNGGRR